VEENSEKWTVYLAVTFGYRNSLYNLGSVMFGWDLATPTGWRPARPMPLCGAVLRSDLLSSCKNNKRAYLDLALFLHAELLSHFFQRNENAFTVLISD